MAANAPRNADTANTETAHRKESTESVELRPDGWERFERAVDAGLHTRPMHRPKAMKDK